MSANGIRERVPFGVGAAAGAAAWVLGYLCTYLITSSDIQNSLIGQFTDIPTWKAVGWVFFNAHFVDTVVELPVVGGATSFVGGEEGFTVLLYVVPPLLLLAAGLAVGRYAGAADAATAAVGGASLVVGYGILSVVGVALFPTENVTPDAVTGVLLAGVVYPVVFGAVGAAVAGATASGS
jgi:hypothetical protein